MPRQKWSTFFSEGERSFARLSRAVHAPEPLGPERNTLLVSRRNSPIKSPGPPPETQRRQPFVHAVEVLADFQSSRGIEALGPIEVSGCLGELAELAQQRRLSRVNVILQIAVGAPVASNGMGSGTFNSREPRGIIRDTITTFLRVGRIATGNDRLYANRPSKNVPASNFYRREWKVRGEVEKKGGGKAGSWTVMDKRLDYIKPLIFGACGNRGIERCNSCCADRGQQQAKITISIGQYFAGALVASTCLWSSLCPP